MSALEPARSKVLKAEIVRLCTAAIKSIGASQQASGGFVSLSSIAVDDFSAARQYTTTFAASLILECINSLAKTPESQQIQTRATRFLLREKNKAGSWNYWPRSSTEALRMPYPDDLDDTFCAASALSRFSGSSIDGTELAQLVQVLVLAETQPGGPYRTWLVPAGAAQVWQDIDLAVNSNIAYFLSLYKVSLPGLNEFLESQVVLAKYESSYYPSWHAPVYFLSRGYQGSNQGIIKDFILSKRAQDGSWGNPLNTALSMSALLRLGVDQNTLFTSADYLTRKGVQDGWGIYAFCFDPAVGKQKQFAGSDSLTTAFCLEALQLYIESNPKCSAGDAQMVIYKEVLDRVEARFNTVGSVLGKEGKHRMEILAKDHADVLLLPWKFAQGLPPRKGVIVGQDTLIALSLANVYGWMAYGIIDDCLDNESGGGLLPLACLALREVVNIYAQLFIFPPAVHGRADSGEYPALKNCTGSMYDLFHKLLDNLDKANIREIQQDKLPIFSNIVMIKTVKTIKGHRLQAAEKSIGHAIGPLAILHLLGYQSGSVVMSSAQLFFIHYLALRQLHDDAHDWQSDLLAGRCSWVVAMLLRLWQKRGYGKSVNLVSDMPALVRLYWQEGITLVARGMREHIAKGRSALAQSFILENHPLLKDMLRSLERSMLAAEDESKRTFQFLKTMGSKRDV